LNSSGKKEPTEIITSTAVKRLVNLNKEICKELKKPFGVDQSILNEIIHSVNLYTDVVDSRARIAKKAANLLAGITTRRPFANGNFESGFQFMLNFVEDAGFDLPYHKAEQLLLVSKFVHDDYSKIQRIVEKYLLDYL